MAIHRKLQTGTRMVLHQLAKTRGLRLSFGICDKVRVYRGEEYLGTARGYIDATTMICVQGSTGQTFVNQAS